MEKKGVKEKRFVRDLIVVAFLVVSLVVGSIVYLASQAKRDISEQYIRNAAVRAAEDFHSMQSSIERSLQQVCDYGETGLISLSDLTQLKEQLMPFFRKEPMLSGISIADGTGKSYFLLPDGTERRPEEADGFDPRTRPWFAPALKGDEVFWSEQYLFHTLKKVGITASASFISPKTKEKVVVAFDILLPDFYERVKAMEPSQNSRIFIFRRDEMLFLPDEPDAEHEFIPVPNPTNSLIGSAHALWGKGMHSGEEIFPLNYQGKVWWCGFQPLDMRRQSVWIGILVPESDILGDVGRRWRFLAGLGFAILLIPGLAVFWLIRRYARIFNSLDELDRPYTQNDVEEMIAKGENRYVEFKSTMRMNLHRGKPGKEIELAWLKGVAAFLNTDGGTLLLGVTDAGEITGLEQDVFENEDKCRLHFKNLIAAHIGAEMSQYIRFQLLHLRGKTIGIVHCSRSPDPVFLQNGNKEAFYIRNGPSSDELPISKAMKYIQERQEGE